MPQCENTRRKDCSAHSDGMDAAAAHQPDTGYSSQLISVASLADIAYESLMRREKMRLLSFSLWSEITGTPQIHCTLISPEQLAMAGFYYMGQYDDACCAFCRNILRAWKAGEVPEVEHRICFPQCPFLSKPAGNVPAAQDNQPPSRLPVFYLMNLLRIIPDSPKFPRYARQTNRLKTFMGFPSDACVSKERLAGAGFFYKGQYQESPFIQ